VVSRIKALGVRGRWEEALDEFRASERTTTIYNAAISAALRCTKYVEGLRLFDDMRRSSVALSASTYTAVMAIHSHQGSAAEVRSLLDELLYKWEAPLAVAFTPLMNVKASVGDAAGVQAAFDEMARFSIKPDSAHYGCLLKAHRTAADFQMTLKVLRDMRAVALQPTVVDYTIAMGTIRTSAFALVDPQVARQHIRGLLARMAEDGVVANQYLVEEQVAAHLGQDLRAASMSKLRREHVPMVADAALNDIRQYENLGVKLTGMTRRIQHMLLLYASSAEYTTKHSGVLHGLRELPDGWHSTVDPAGGGIYYYSDSGASQWERPVAPQPESSPQGLPAGWHEAVDPVSGGTYYYDTSGVAQWERPTEPSR